MVKWSKTHVLTALVRHWITWNSKKPQHVYGLVETRTQQVRTRSLYYSLSPVSCVQHLITSAHIVAHIYAFTNSAWFNHA